MIFVNMVGTILVVSVAILGVLYLIENIRFKDNKD